MNPYAKQTSPLFYSNSGEKNRLSHSSPRKKYYAGYQEKPGKGFPQTDEILRMFKGQVVSLTVETFAITEL